MVGIDDFFKNHAHRRELAPGYDPEDDLADNLAIWEIPGRTCFSEDRRPPKGNMASARKSYVGADGRLLRCLTASEAEDYMRDWCANHPGWTKYSFRYDERLKNLDDDDWAKLSEAADRIYPEEKIMPRKRESPRPLLEPVKICPSCGSMVQNGGLCRCG